MEDLSPIEQIQRFRDERQHRTDSELLNELRHFSPLPDDDWRFPRTSTAWTKGETWETVYLYLALAELVAQRQLREGVKYLLDNACYGDPGETMRTLRGYCEQAFNPDWHELADVCVVTAKSQNKGARLWSIRQLGVLRDPRSLTVLVDALYDTAQLVRLEAITSLEMLLQKSPQLSDIVLSTLERIYNDEKDLLEELKDTISKLKDKG
ncbi:MAG: HEAT repeat domain-containing protein [Chloroflexota bacterium]|nr:HEAT repeat domain-containing protein [Chloroflexota bacterium]